MKVPEPVVLERSPPPIYERGLTRFNPERQRQLMLAQYTDFAPPPSPADPNTASMRRIQFLPRNDTTPDLLSKTLPSGERVAIASGGIRLLVDGLPSTSVPSAFGAIGTLDISTDRAVVWTAGDALSGSGQSFQGHDVPLEIYMEGNIEFRQGE